MEHLYKYEILTILYSLCHILFFFAIQLIESIGHVKRVFNLTQKLHQASSNDEWISKNVHRSIFLWSFSSILKFVYFYIEKHTQEIL